MASSLLIIQYTIVKSGLYCVAPLEGHGAAYHIFDGAEISKTGHHGLAQEHDERHQEDHGGHYRHIAASWGKSKCHKSNNLVILHFSHLPQVIPISIITHRN